VLEGLKAWFESEVPHENQFLYLDGFFYALDCVRSRIGMRVLTPYGFAKETFLKEDNSK